MDEAALTPARTAVTALAPPGRKREGAAPYEPPRFEVIALDCEITAYAPDGDPLF